MRFGYVAKIKAGASVEEQREALADVGAAKIIAEKVWKRKPRPDEDPRPERADLIAILRPGDELCVLSPLHLAANAGDLFSVLAAVTDQRASVYVIDMAENFTADESHAKIAKALTRDKRQAQTANARGSEKHKKNPGGRPKALADLDRAAWAQFDRDWKDDAISIPQMARKWKVSEATISRKAAARKLGRKA